MVSTARTLATGPLNASSFFLAGAALLLQACSQPYLVDHAINVGRGEALFANYCTACHGVDGTGSSLAKTDLKPPPPVLLAMSGATPLQYFVQIHDGSRQMPQMHDELTDEDIWNIVYALPKITGRENPNWLESERWKTSKY